MPQMPTFPLADLAGTWAFQITGPVVPTKNQQNYYANQQNPQPNPQITVSGTFVADANGNIPAWTDSEFPGEIRTPPQTYWTDNQGPGLGNPPAGTDIQLGRLGATQGMSGQLLLRFHQGQKGGLFGPWFPFTILSKTELMLSGVAGPGLSYSGTAKKIVDHQ